MWGEPRSTQDVDIGADLTQGKVPELVRRLAGDYYIDLELVTEAVARGASFNIIHLATLFKVDVFVARTDELRHGQIRRGETIAIGPTAATVPMSGAEDTVIQKLIWFRLGGEVSDRQWRDVIAVLRVRAGLLDEGLLDRLSVEGGVNDLLDRARAEAIEGS